jgi:hypothetical protein
VERRGPSVGNVGEWCVESWHLQGCSSRLCRLSIVGLAPMSKYWTYRSHAGDMGPVSLVVYHWQILGFAPTASKLAQERNWVRIMSACCGLCREPFFSGAVALLNFVDDSWKAAKYRNYPQEAYARHTWTGVESVRVMLIGFSPAGCTSIQIAATLRYE